MSIMIIFIFTYVIQLAFLFMLYSFTTWMVHLWMHGKEMALTRVDIDLLKVIATLVSLGIIGVITSIEITYENENNVLYATLISSGIVALAKSILSVNTSTKPIDFFIINLFYYTQPITYYLLIFNCPWDLMF